MAAREGAEADAFGLHGGENSRVEANLHVVLFHGPLSGRVLATNCVGDFFFRPADVYDVRRDGRDLLFDNVAVVWVEPNLATVDVHVIHDARRPQDALQVVGRRLDADGFLFVFFEALVD